MTPFRWFFVCSVLGVFVWILCAINQVSFASDPGPCIGDCGAELGMCIAQCRGDASCISYCQQAHGRCIARCVR